ncbi:hypothetical protein H9X89_16955, partial [Faecalicatena contorta]|nr:hypothetical protein [Faecalicatena contorta]
VAERGATLVIENARFRHVLDRRTGLFDTMTVGNHSLLDAPMSIDIWRAPTDNDQYVKAQWFAARYDHAATRAYDMAWS